MNRVRIIVYLLFLIFCLNNRAEVYFDRSGECPRLMVDGSPMLIIGGELGNSSATCAQDIRRNIGKLKKMNLNSVLVPAYWNLMEPEEGQFSFSIIDSVINEAEKNDLKVVFLWFGAWKNSMSCYAPAWFKRDYIRFPRARTKSGKSLEIASAFSKNVFKSDSTAFSKWLEYLNERDSNSTVIAIQIENEIGMLEDARDYSNEANAIFKKGIPKKLADYINTNREKLHPYLKDLLKVSEIREGMSWYDTFGPGIFADEIFMSWHYATYVQSLAQCARKISPRVLYVNAALDSRGRSPGQYPSAGPLAKLIDIWHAAAPDIDFISPDIYDKGFRDWVAQYAIDGNTLFIPEIRESSTTNAPQAFYAICEHDAIGLCPFSIENGSDHEDSPSVKGRGLLLQMAPLLLRHQGTGAMNGLYFDSDSKERIILRDSIKISARHYFTLPWDPRATDGSIWPETGGAIIKLAPMKYLVAGSGIVIEFDDLSADDGYSGNLGEDGFAQSGNEGEKISDINQWHGRRIGLADVKEVTVDAEGRINVIRSLGGDETHQGRHVRISPDDYKILLVSLYEYR